MEADQRLMAQPSGESALSLQSPWRPQSERDRGILYRNTFTLELQQRVPTSTTNSVASSLQDYRSSRSQLKNWLNWAGLTSGSVLCDVISQPN